MTEPDEGVLKLFLNLGLDESTAKSGAKNGKFVKTLTEVIKEAGAESGCPRNQGNLLYAAATKFPANALAHRPQLLKYVMSNQIKTVPQLDGAVDYLKRIGAESIDTAALETAAGVGVVISAEQINSAVTDVITANKQQLLTDRYHLNTNILLGQVTKALKWADGAAVKAELDSQVEALLGPKTEDDLKPREKPKKAPKADGDKAADKAAAAKADSKPAEPAAPEDPYAFFPKPEENNVVHTSVLFSDGKTVHMSNPPEKLAAHLAKTKGKVITRFPPEPNGYLHIGHAKAMFVDFGMAAQYGGVCYLRYDDTNPEAEKLEYIEHIQDIVKWMGWAPWKITYSSDYFQELYELAVELIKRGHAYVCHQTKDEIESSREKKEPSPWRDRPVEENLALFEEMRTGRVDEGKATLRMKMDYKNENPNMFDLIAYRIKMTPHPHVGDKWVIYPSYDYTHCLVDSLEDITHSLCTLEFETRRASYYWLLDVLDMYKPLVWEYARLNITNNVMSKRKLNKLVTANIVNGWDDPRLMTLSGLRRRGVTPAAINAFIREGGISRNTNMAQMHRLEHNIRLDLDAHSPRTLAVLRPLKVVISNLPADHFETVEAQTFPGREGSVAYSVPFTRVVYLEATDFREVDEKDYYGLAPGKSVMLRYAYPITCTGFRKDPSSGQISELQVTYDPDYKSKKAPKGVLNWVGQPAPGQDPPTWEARLYDVLFRSEDPAASDTWLEEMNPDSLTIVKGAMATSALASAKVGDRFQFERLGYFCMDPDSTPELPVFNRTVSLKESSLAKTVTPAAGKKK